MKLLQAASGIGAKNTRGPKKKSTGINSNRILINQVINISKIDNNPVTSQIHFILIQKFSSLIILMGNQCLSMK